MAWALMQGHIRNAAVVTFELEARVVIPLVPDGTELDAWGGRALVSLVAFHFADNRVLGLPLPFAREYDQIDFRFYVRRLQPDGTWRRGVVFLREMLPAASIVAGARIVFGENYQCMSVTSRVREPEAIRSGRAIYRWRDRGHVHRLALDFHGPPAVPAPGSFESFLAERHFGYVAAGDGATREYRVDHPPWRVWRADATRLSRDAAESFGAPFEPALVREPVSAFVAEGSRLLLHRPHPLAAAVMAAQPAQASEYARSPTWRDDAS